MALLLLFSFVVLQFLMRALLSIPGKLGLNLDDAALILFSQIITGSLVLCMGVRIAGISWSECYPLRAFQVNILAPLVMTSVGGTFLLLEILGWIPLPEPMQQGITEVFSGNRVLVFLIVVVIGPCVEELLFRGWMLQSFLRRYSVRKSILISTLFFAIIHVHPWYAAVMVPLGIFFAWLVIKTGSLIPSILSHSVFNVTAVFLVDSVSSLLGYDPEAIRNQGHFPLPLLGAASVLTAVGGLILHRKMAQNRNK